MPASGYYLYVPYFISTPHGVPPDPVQVALNDGDITFWSNCIAGLSGYTVISQSPAGGFECASPNNVLLPDTLPSVPNVVPTCVAQAGQTQEFSASLIAPSAGAGSPGNDGWFWWIVFQFNGIAPPNPPYPQSLVNTAPPAQASYTRSALNWPRYSCERHIKLGM